MDSILALGRHAVYGNCWHLDPLTVRDSTANNLAMALDFSHRNLSAPAFTASRVPVIPCSLTQIIPNDWDDLTTIAQSLGII